MKAMIKMILFLRPSNKIIHLETWQVKNSSVPLITQTLGPPIPRGKKRVQNLREISLTLKSAHAQSNLVGIVPKTKPLLWIASLNTLKL